MGDERETIARGPQIEQQPVLEELPSRAVARDRDPRISRLANAVRQSEPKIRIGTADTVLVEGSPQVRTAADVENASEVTYEVHTPLLGNERPLHAPEQNRAINVDATDPRREPVSFEIDTRTWE